MHNYVSNQKPYLLDPNVLVDTPMPVFKPFTDLINENLSSILIILLILFIGIVFFIFKKKKIAEILPEPKQAPIDPFKDALNQIEGLAQTFPRLPAKPFIFKLSEILRLYVERQFNLPALECTGEEFIRKVSLHPLLRQKFETPLKLFVQRGDRIKYSTENSNEDEILELLQSARDFINQAQIEHESQIKQQREILNSYTNNSQE
tara:strand:+ start:3793 stop:4407 length:615 start_codon:yes stop_codon:yes gene_type:complete